MAIGSRVAALLERVFARMLAKPEDPSYGWRSPRLPHSWLPAGVHVTMESALQLSAVWACIDVISKSIASCTWSVFTQDRDGRRTVLRDDPLNYLLNTRPNPDMPAVAFKQGILISALSWGNGYAEIVPDGAGRVAQLWPLSPDRVTPRRDPATLEIFYEYDQPYGGTGVIPASRMYHLRGPGISGLMGDNFVARMAKTVALNAAAETFSSTYFGNNTVLGGVLEYPKTLDDKTYARLKTSWEERFKGPFKAHSPAILEGGMKWVPHEADASKAQMIEARKFQLEEIARWYGVPLHKIQHIDRATFNNIEHLGIEFVRDSLTPWALRMEQEADHKLFSARGASRFTKLDMAWLLYGDAKSRAEYYQIMRRIGAYSVNEIRAREGDNSIGDEGDVRIVETNMQTLEKLALDLESAKLKSLPDIFAYHLEQGIPTKNEVRARLGLPPVEGGDEFTKPVQVEVDKQQADNQAEADEEKDDREDDDQEDDGQEKDGVDEAAAMVRDAAVTLFASTLDRYARRLRSREADLARNGLKNGRVASNLAQERERLKTSWLLPECENALGLVMRLGGRLEDRDVVGVICNAAETVDNGEEPRAAAARIVANLLSAATVTTKEMRS